MTPPPPTLLSQLHTLEQREAGLARLNLEKSGSVELGAELTLRAALALARLYALVAPDGAEIDLSDQTAPLREEVIRLLDGVGLVDRHPGELDLDGLHRIAWILRSSARACWTQVIEAIGDRVPRETLDRELRQKSLVMAVGGGAGAGHVYLGVFELLEESGLRPALLAGTSIGALYSLFRARSPGWSTPDTLAILKTLTWKGMFRKPKLESWFGLPAAVRMFLRENLGWHLGVAGAPMPALQGAPLGEEPAPSPAPEDPEAIAAEAARVASDILPFSSMSIPLILTASGLRLGTLPRAPGDYAELLRGVDLQEPESVARATPQIARAFLELGQLTERLEPVYFGLDEGSEGVDAIDAAGFSAAVPGVLHYDVPPQAETRHARLEAFLHSREIGRLCDGGLVENVPARGAFLGVHSGKIATRNALILGLDCFAPRFPSPFLALQSLIALQARRSAGYAHSFVTFRRVPSPLALFPDEEAALKWCASGREELEVEMPLIKKLMAPFEWTL